MKIVNNVIYLPELNGIFMLIEFKFKNFLSFKDETRLLMTSVKTFKENPEAIITTKRPFDLLKTAAIFGANAAGKSNLIWAMFAMTRTIFNSFSNSLKKKEDREDAIFQFLLIRPLRRLI